MPILVVDATLSTSVCNSIAFANFFTKILCGTLIVSALVSLYHFLQTPKQTPEPAVFTSPIHSGSEKIWRKLVGNTVVAVTTQEKKDM